MFDRFVRPSIEAMSQGSLGLWLGWIELGERIHVLPTFTFTLVVEGPDVHCGEIVNALFEAGCDDALVRSSDGIQSLDFDREADSLEEAVLSAVTDVESVDGLKVVRLVDVGLLSIADTAERPDNGNSGAVLDADPLMLPASLVEALDQDRADRL